MKYYAIADLHGRFDLLKMAHDQILEYHITDEPYHIITLGDYIDRGPDSKGVIEYLYEHRNYETFISLAGNHEAMMVETIRAPLNPAWWLGNGGDATLRSYGGDPIWRRQRYDEFVANYDPHVIPLEHVEWIANLPLYYETDQQVFVHAGVVDDGPLESQNPERLQWMLYNKNDNGGWRGKHVVHGHHQFKDGPHSWSGRTDLDTFAWYTGRLVIGVFDDTQPAAVDFIEIKGEPYG